MADQSGRYDLLLDRLRKRERDALADLFEHFRPRLRQVLRVRMEGPIEARVDASDVLQETYLDAARKLENFLRGSNGTSLFVWLRGLTCDRLKRIQRRHLGAQCRAQSREVRLPDEPSVLLARQLLAEGTTPSQAVVAIELRNRVGNALNKLKDEDREVIVMRHFEGLSNEEVAQVLGLSVSGATMRHGRALMRLKQMLLADLSSGESRP